MATENRRSVHRTQWAAQFAVASELCKRDYEVALTMGNHPSVDLMVKSADGISFGIDVKGLYRRNWWLVTRKPLKTDLYYVFAYVPNDEPNQFFILTHERVNAEIDAASAIARGTAESEGRVSTFDKIPGISWSVAERYQDWGILPGGPHWAVRPASIQP